MTVEKEFECLTQQGNINIPKEDVSISNWKAPGPDESHGFWLKKFTFLHQAMVKHLDNCTETGDATKWMIESGTVLIQKEA